MARLRKIKGYYYGRIRYNSRKEKTIPLNTRLQKEAYVRLTEVNQYEELIKSGETYTFPWQNDGKTELIEKQINESVKEFLYVKETDGLAISTIKSYKLSLDDFQKVIGPKVPTEKLLIQHIDLYKKNKVKHLKPTTINIRLRSIKVFMNWCIDNGYLKKVPKINFIKINKSEPKYLSDSEFLKVEEQCSNFFKDAFNFYRETGCRMSEPYFGILDEEFLTIPAEHSKSKQSRDIELSKEAIKTFLKMKSKGYKSNYYSKTFTKVSRNAGIQNKTLHCLRHTSAIKQYFETKDIYAVARKLGHSDLKTTMIYTKFEEKKIKKDFPDIFSKKS